MAFTTKELSVHTFPDFERVALKQGWCWCMHYQRPRPVYDSRLPRAERRPINKRDKKMLVRKGSSHAILVYDGETPVGWCQYGTADELPRIDAGRDYKKVGRPNGMGKLWRITCFFVDRKYRRKGVAKLALKVALQSIQRKGGGIVEAYPVVSSPNPVSYWCCGPPTMFQNEGFRTVVPLGTGGVLMQKEISP